MKEIKDLKNYFEDNNLSDKTKNDIKTAIFHGYDAIGEFFINPEEKSVFDLIQFAHSLAAPNYDDLKTKSEWSNFSSNWHGNVMEGILPYNNKEEFNSFALSPTQNKKVLSNIIIPLTTNFSSNSLIGQKNEAVERIEKIWNFFKNSLNLEVLIDSTYGQTSYELKSNKIKIKLSKDSNLFEAFAIACSCVAEKILTSKQKMNSYEEIAAKKLATIGIARSFNLNNSDISKQIDKALTLDFYTFLGNLSGQRKDCVKRISESAATVLENFIEMLPEGFIEKSAENLEKLGFKFSKEQKTAFSSLKQKDFPSLILASKFDFMKLFNIASKAIACLAAAAVGGHRIKLQTLLQRVDDNIPGIIRNRLFTPKEETKRNKEKSVPMSALLINSKKYLPELKGKEREKVLNSEKFQTILNDSFDSEIRTVVDKIKDWVKEEYNSGDRHRWTNEAIICGANDLEVDKRNTKKIATSVLISAANNALKEFNKGKSDSELGK